VENQEKDIAVIPAADYRRKGRLIEGASTIDAFSGWGPGIAGSNRNILRGLN
jgi:hypothetical protein